MQKEIRAWLKRIGIVCLTPIALIALASALLYVPAIQNVAVNKAVGYVADATELHIGFERLRLAFPLRLSVHDAFVKSVNNDTILHLDKIGVQVRLLPLLKGNVSVKSFILDAVDVNTGALLENLSVSGHIGRMYLRADSIQMKERRVLLNQIVLSDANVRVFASDTATTDTTSSEAGWRIGITEIKLQNIAFALQTRGDSLPFGLHLHEASLTDGMIDTDIGRYSVSNIQVNLPEISPFGLHDVCLSLDSLLFEGERNIHAVLRDCSAKSAFGVEVKSLTGRVEADNIQINVPLLTLKTNYSSIEMQATTAWSALDAQKQEGAFDWTIKASIGKNDWLTIAGENAADLSTHCPDTTFIIETSGEGNDGRVTINTFVAELPGAFDLKLTGAVSSIMDDRFRLGKINYQLETQKADFVAAMIASQFMIPDNLRLSGHITMNKSEYAVDATLAEKSVKDTLDATATPDDVRKMSRENSMGNARFSGRYDASNKSYEAALYVDKLSLARFMPDAAINYIDAFVRAKGQGVDVFLPSTFAEVELKINKLSYGKQTPEISGVALSGNLKNCRLQAALNSNYPSAKGHISIDGELNSNNVKGICIVDVQAVDFQKLGVIDTPFISTSFQLFSEVETDLDKKHALDVTMGNCSVVFDEQTVQPKMLTLALRSDDDTTRVSLHAGDLDVALSGNAGLQTLMNKFAKIADDIAGQMKRDSTVDIQALRPSFPDLSLQIEAQHDNPLYALFQEYGLFFDNFTLNATLAPDDGLQLNASLLSLVKDTLKIDTIKLHAWQDTLGVQYEADVVKKRFRNQQAFNATAKGYIRKGEADVFMSFVDNNGEKGLLLGVNAQKAADGIVLRLYPENAVIAFLPFTVNPRNYFRFGSLQDMNADIYMESHSLAALRVYSDENVDGRPSIVWLELNGVDLDKLSRRFASTLPPLKGILNATMKYEPTNTSFTLAADGYINNLHYDNGRVGDILLNMNYVPVEKNVHQLDMHVFHDQNRVSSLSLLYSEGRKTDAIEGRLTINRLPLNMLNSVLPPLTAVLDGFVNGDFAITGATDKPVVTGTLQFVDGAATLTPLATTFYFDDKPIVINQNKVKIDKYGFYTVSKGRAKDNPFVVDGAIDATNVDRPFIDLNLTAANMRVIDTKKKPESLAFGRLFVNLNVSLRGALASPRIRGAARILGNTNMTCIMPGEQPELNDHFADLVTFTYFADTLPRRMRMRQMPRLGAGRNRAATRGMDVTMTVDIDPIARLKVELDEEQSNYVELQGGGNLSLRYTQAGDWELNGKYTMTDGTIRYNIPVIPLTDFSIRNGSYVDWRGNIMNPYLNMTAYTQVKTAVNFDGQARMVDFNAGIQIEDELEKMNVRFLLEAPNDAITQNRLAVMGDDERSKQAISLLVAGVYMAGGANAEGVDVGGALSSILQREIKNKLGAWTGESPFALDVVSYDGTNGMGRQIDYIGRFYKSFFSERLRTTLGLRYSVQDPIYGNRLLLDDISLEYRPNTNGERSFRLFHDKDYVNVFEGEVTKTGVAFTLRRKAKRLGDLFIPK